MADKKISQLTAASTPLAGTEVLPIVQSGSTVKVSAADVTAGRAVSALTYASTATTGTAPFTVASTTEVANLRAANATSADTANAVKSNATTGILQVVGPAAAATRVMTVPDANFSAARIDAAQTFTGLQTLGSISITGNGYSYSQSNSGTTRTAGTISNSGGTLDFGVESSAGGTIFTNAAAYTGNIGTAGNTNFNLCANGTVRATVTTAGNLSIANGNLVPATAGKGIDFSANTHAAGMTSELLNWYEEGTWTPTFTSGITSPTYSTQNGAYTRVGRIVYFMFRLELSAGTGAAAILQIGGLPFTVNGTFRGGAAYFGYAAGTIVSSTSTNLPTINCAAGSTVMSFYKTDGAAFNGSDLATAANFSADISGWYFV